MDINYAFSELDKQSIISTLKLLDQSFQNNNLGYLVKNTSMEENEIYL